METTVESVAGAFAGHCTTESAQVLTAAETTPRTAVLLLKEARGDAQQDPYHLALASAGFTPSFLPVLDHVLINEAELQQQVERGPATTSALVITSQRAVEAWDAAQRAAGREAALGWTEVPIFVVGPATAEALSSIEAPPRQVLGADASGTGGSLARFIVDYYTQQTPSSPLLYLVGDKRRDVLPAVLREANVLYEELEVYRTDARAGFAADFEAALATMDMRSSPWIVFFSPSGVKVALPILRARGSFERVRTAAIGPTTRDFLRDEMGVEADAMAVSPSAEQLVGALSGTQTVVG